MGVAREMGRLIRLSYNGHLPPDELTRYIFALDKLRACLESANTIEVAAAERAAEADAQGPTIRSVNVISIPSDHYLSAEDLARMRVPGLAIEHQAPVEPVIEQSASIDQEIVPRSAEEMSTASVEEEKQLIDKLTIEIRELAQRAGVSLVT